MTSAGAQRLILLMFGIAVVLITLRALRGDLEVASASGAVVSRPTIPAPARFTGAVGIYGGSALLAEAVPGLGLAFAMALTLGLATANATARRIFEPGAYTGTVPKADLPGTQRAGI